jgi:hypothetical protein
MSKHQMTSTRYLSPYVQCHNTRYKGGLLGYELLAGLGSLENHHKCFQGAVENGWRASM